MLEINVSLKIKPYEKSNEELALLADGSYRLYRFFNLIGMPHDGNPNYWELVIYSKFTAVALAYFDIRLYVWFAKHRKIDELLEYINEDK